MWGWQEITSILYFSFVRERLSMWEFGHRLILYRRTFFVLLLLCPMKIMVTIWGSNFGIQVPSSGLSTFIIYARAANLTVFTGIHLVIHSVTYSTTYLPNHWPKTQLSKLWKICLPMQLVLAWSEINLLHRKGKAKDTSYKLICRFEMKLFRCLKLCSVLKMKSSY